VADRVLAWLGALPTLPSYLALMALSAIENVFPPVPADVAVALGAFLARHGRLSAPLLGLVCWLANTASAAWIYLFARSHGAAFFRHGWGSRVMPPSAMRAVEVAYRKHGALGIFVTRFLPGVRAAVLPFAGVAGMPMGRAMLPAVTASALWYAFLVSVGSLLGENWEAVQATLGDVTQGLGLLAIVATLALAVWLWRRSR
jgi:membrane protein DedA with SNARE-associated domain